MSKYAVMADEIECARNDHINSFGSVPSEVSSKRAALDQLLRSGVSAIIEALRIAAAATRS